MTWVEFVLYAFAGLAAKPRVKAAPAGCRVLWGHWLEPVEQK
jgi:hypothetical protein